MKNIDGLSHTNVTMQTVVVNIQCVKCVLCEVVCQFP